MKAIIFGASSHTSLGYHIGHYLESKNKYTIIYTSRSGKLGIKCDVNEPKQILSILSKERPDLVVYAAGIFNKPQTLGSLKKIAPIRDHILAKSFGALMLADAIAKRPSVKKIIMLGGRAISSDPGFATYSIANGALWALVSFFAKHNHTTKIFYIDLPLVENTTMARSYISLGGDSGSQTKIDSVTHVIEKILKNKYKSGSRIVINKKSEL